MSSQVFSMSRDRDSTTCLGNLCQCLTTLTVKKCFLAFRWNLMFFNLYGLFLVLSQGTTEKSLALTSSLSPVKCLYILIWSLLSLLFSRLNRLSCLSPSSWEKCSNPLIILANLHWTHCIKSIRLCTWESRTGCSTPDVALPVLRRKEGSLPST